jgi:uncharacterized membrane protein
MDYLHLFAHWASIIFGAIGVFIMLYGSMASLYHFTRSCLTCKASLPNIRIELGKYLALGLEFLVGKDIILSMLQPSWDELGKLTVLVLLRTIVAVVLAWEIREAQYELKNT